VPKFTHSSATLLVAALALASCGPAAGPGTPGALPFAAARQPLALEPLTPYHKGLLALYSFNGTLKDSSGHGYTASISGVPRYAPGAPFGGKAIAFGGGGKAIVTGPIDISVKQTRKLTMGGWFMATSIKTPQYGIVSNDDGGYDRTIDIDTRNQARSPYWSAFVGGRIAGTVPVTKGRWTFVAVTYDQSTMPGTYALYVNDGRQTYVIRGAADFDSSSHIDKVTIGRNPSFDHPFAGKAANVFFYVGILTNRQIANIVAHGPSRIPRH
jgi:hypothetical protein